MSKVYVLDSNVLLHDPQALFVFPGNEVVVPGVVIEELDGKKFGPYSTGHNARQVARMLDGFRRDGGVREPVPLPNGGTLRVELNHRSLEVLREQFPEVNNDNRLLAVALNLKAEEEAGDHPRVVVLVSQDVIVRIKADALGLEAEDYPADKPVTPVPGYAGYLEVYVEPSLIDCFYRERRLPVSELPQVAQLLPNQYVILRDANSTTKSALARYHQDHQQLEPLLHCGETVWGITARSAQQKMALDLLMDDEIPLVTLTGRAGTGKTLLALAAGLVKSQEEGRYLKLLVSRPVVPMGKDIGFLPGDKEEKLRPWMQPIHDNLDYLFRHRKGGTVDDILVGMKNVYVEALTYIRGRTLPQQFIIVDEAQNLTRHEVKTIVSRVGEGSKVVLLGDPEQIDHPYLDAASNGLMHAVEVFKDQPLAGHVTLQKGERSPLAQLAAELL